MPRPLPDDVLPWLPPDVEREDEDLLLVDVVLPVPVDDVFVLPLDADEPRELPVDEEFPFEEPVDPVLRLWELPRADLVSFEFSVDLDEPLPEEVAFELVEREEDDPVELFLVFCFVVVAMSNYLIFIVYIRDLSGFASQSGRLYDARCFRKKRNRRASCYVFHFRAPAGRAGHGDIRRSGV